MDWLIAHRGQSAQHVGQLAANASLPMRRSGPTGVSRIIWNLARQYYDRNWVWPIATCAYDASAAIRPQKTMALRQ
jgi:hypothetical protein